MVQAGGSTIRKGARKGNRKLRGEPHECPQPSREHGSRSWALPTFRGEGAGSIRGREARKQAHRTLALSQGAGWGHSQDVSQGSQLLLGHLAFLERVPIQVQQVILTVQTAQPQGALRSTPEEEVSEHECSAGTQKQRGRRAQKGWARTWGAWGGPTTCSPGSAPGSRAWLPPGLPGGRCGRPRRRADASLVGTQGRTGCREVGATPKEPPRPGPSKSLLNSGVRVPRQAQNIFWIF